MWRTGVGPRKADKGLRGFGLLVLVFAFLIASNRFVSGDNDKTTPSTEPTGPIAVLADASLTAILPVIDKAPRYAYRPEPSTATTPATPEGTPSPAGTGTTPSGTTTTADPAVARADVVVTSDSTLLDAIVAAKECAPAVTVATDTTARPARVYRACAVLHRGAVRPKAQTYIGTLVGLTGRVGFLDAGFDLPPRSG